MKIAQIYSHLNGEEFLLVHKPNLYKEIRDTIEEVNAEKFKTKLSKELRKKDRVLYSPSELNREFARILAKKGWNSNRRDFFVSSDWKVVRLIEPLDYKAQAAYLDSIGAAKISSYNQTDFVKETVAVEVQLGKYFAVTYDLFVKHLSFYTGGLIDVGIEIVPTKTLQQQMSSGVPFYDKEVHNILRHGRTNPPVPLVVIGIEYDGPQKSDTKTGLCKVHL